MVALNTVQQIVATLQSQSLSGNGSLQVYFGLAFIYMLDNYKDLYNFNHFHYYDFPNPCSSLLRIL